MKHLLIVVLLGSLAACASTGGAGNGSSEVVIAAAPSGTAPPSAAVQPQARLQAGRALFSARCQSCHALPDPNRLSPEKWPAQITVMSRKSGLSRDQIALVTDYVVAASRTHN